jgi:glucose dehydrogenase
VSAEWVFDFMASPSVVDGTMYVGGPDGFVNAVDVDTGKEKWRYEVGEGLSGLPVVTEGKVFVGQMKGPGRFCALDRETGRLIWESGEFSRVWVASAYHDGMLFFGNMDGDMFGVRASDGTRVWSCYTAKDTPLENIPRGSKFVHGFPPGVYSNPAIDDQNVYVGSWAGYYISLDQKTGKVNWSTKTKPEEGGLPDSAAPMLHKNHLYVQKAGKCIAALHKETGEIAWEWEAPLGYLQNETVAAHGDKIFDSLCVRGYDAAVPCDDHCLRRCGERQKKLWEYDGGGGLTAPIITNDKLTHLWLLG